MKNFILNKHFWGLHVLIALIIKKSQLMIREQVSPINLINVVLGDLGADGSVRMFDLRHLEHSTIIYEDAQHHPLLRLCWNKQDPNYLATMAMDAMEVLVLNCFLYTQYKAGHV